MFPRRSHHVENIVLRRIWRDMQTMEVQIGHLHTAMTEAIFVRLGGEPILVFHVQNASRLDPNHRRGVFALILKSGFTGDWVRHRHQRHRRFCLWQFLKYSVVPTRGRNRQSNGYYPAT